MAHGCKSPQAGSRSYRLQGLIAFLLLYLILVVPTEPVVLADTRWLRLPLELPLIVLLVMVVPGIGRRWLRCGLAALLGLLVVLKIAEVITYLVFAREFNAFLHLPVVWAGLNVVSGTLGPVVAGLFVLLLLAIAAALVWILYWALGIVSAPSRSNVRWPAAVAAALTLGIFGVLDRADVTRGNDPLVVADAYVFLRDHAVEHIESAGDLKHFNSEIAGDPFREVPSDRLLSGLGHTSVLLVFVESYGRSAVENPIYAPMIRETLKNFESEIAGAGFDARSAWLASPTYGGQSWLAHSTLLSGLRIDRQGRYDALLMSDRSTLIKDFGRAGWRTIAAMPAITMVWPEANFFGYDKVYRGPDFAYAGDPFGWITMPDQFTLSALQRLELGREDQAPVLAEVALVSSHAPWTPIPKLVPWNAVGDGSIFDGQNRSGISTEELWRSIDRVREYYGRAIVYDLETLKSFITTYGTDDLMLIVLGDHQPMPVVSDNAPAPDVPIHIMARNPQLLRALDGWQWTKGMIPGSNAPVWPMEEMRGRFVATFTPPP